MLLPCDHLPLETKPPAPVKPKKNKPAQTPVSEVSEDDDDEEPYFPPNLIIQPPVLEKDTTLFRDCDPDTNDTTAPTPLQFDDVTGAEDAHEGDADDAEVSFASSDTQEDETDARPQRPQRDRRAPKMFRYNTLGIPSCYYVATPYGLQTWPESKYPYSNAKFYLCGM